MHPRTLLIALCSSLLALAPSRAADQPNILYIVSDDLGWKDVGFHGAADIKTPNIDKLAADGARLEQFYVQPMCTPTRAALMTGRYPLRYGLQTLVIPTKATYGLATDEYLLPQALKDAGYRTEMVGKWHLGHADRKYWPRQRGFDYHYGAVIGEIDYFTHDSHGQLDWQRDNKAVKETGYVTQLLGADAIKVIGKHDTKTPLFMYLAFTAPHAPYQAPKEYLDRYKDIADAAMAVMMRKLIMVSFGFPACDLSLRLVLFPHRHQRHSILPRHSAVTFPFQMDASREDYIPPSWNA